jgi:predicted 3-demethylubiquinone-9 3-methyltransferase (glyoxalase superfamily)
VEAYQRLGDLALLCGAGQRSCVGRAKLAPGPKGTVMTVEFELDGQKFVALHGGPVFKFTQAISFAVHCETQAEVDKFREKHSQGG